MTAQMIYMTAASREEAETIGRALVAERLVACVNILPGMRSIYWWDGKPTEDDEVAVIMKTRRELVDRVCSRVRDMHSYDCPCVVALDITAGAREFLDWIETETKSAAPG